MPKSVSGITRMAHEHPKFRHFAPLKIYSPGVWVWRCREKWCKKIARALVDWQRFLGYVEVFSRPKHSHTRSYHHFWVCWTSQKSHFRRRSFPRLLTSDVPKSTHWEPVSMLRRLIWCWTSHMGCMQLLWAVYALSWLWLHHFVVQTRHNAPEGLI